MKINLVCYSLHGGGAERVTVNLADAWAKQGHEVVITLCTPAEEIEYHPDPRVTVDSIGKPPAPLGAPIVSTLWRLAALRRHLRRNGADIVVAMQGNIAIETALASLSTTHRVIGCEHNHPDYAVQGRVWNALRPLAYRRLDALTTLTQGGAAALRRQVPGRDVVIMPNAVRWPMQDSGEGPDPETLVPGDHRLILSAGRLTAAKAYGELIRAFATVVGRRPDCTLVLLGEGEQRDALTALVRELRLETRILLPGRAGNMSRWYRRADLFAMSSAWEGLPMVMLEAMSHGVPVASYDFDFGARDIVRHGIDGLLVPRGDLPGLAEAMAAMLAEDGMREKMGQEATSIRERFGEREILRAWDELFARVLAQRPNAAGGSRSR